MAGATTAGAEVQRPLATVVIVGILVGTLVTPTVLPGIPWLAVKDQTGAPRGQRLSAVD